MLHVSGQGGRHGCKGQGRRPADGGNSPYTQLRISCGVWCVVRRTSLLLEKGGAAKSNGLLVSWSRVQEHTVIPLPCLAVCQNLCHNCEASSSAHYSRMIVVFLYIQLHMAGWKLAIWEDCRKQQLPSHPMRNSSTWSSTMYPVNLPMGSILSQALTL